MNHSHQPDPEDGKEPAIPRLAIPGPRKPGQTGGTPSPDWPLPHPTGEED